MVFRRRHSSIEDTVIGLDWLLDPKLSIGIHIKLGGLF